MTLIIREAVLSDPMDCSGVVEVLNSYASDPLGGGEPLRPDVRGRLASGLRNHPTTVVFVALANGQYVGLAICFLGFSSFQARPLLNIHDLAVVPEWRGKGIGQSLLTSAQAKAADLGCCKLTLEVQDTNHRARAIYERFGFRDFVVGDSGPTRFLSKSLIQP